MNEGLSRRQLRALVLAAGSAPVFHAVCAVSWAWALPAAVGTLALLSLLFRLWPERPGSVLRVLGAIALFILSALAAETAAASFPETAGSSLAAGLVLMLAGLAAGRGPAVPGRSAGVLVWLLAGLYGTVLFFGLTQVKPEWLLPAGGPEQIPRAVAALLLPAAALPLRARSEGKGGLGLAFAALGALAVFACLVTGGSLSPALAREPLAFLTLARSVSVLGVIRRFEVLISGALLISGFFLCCLTLSALREELLHLTGEHSGRICYMAAVAACTGSLWLRSRISGLILGITAICCAFMLSKPQSVDHKKDCKKCKKSVDKQRLWCYYI